MSGTNAVSCNSRGRWGEPCPWTYIAKPGDRGPILELYDHAMRDHQERFRDRVRPTDKAIRRRAS